MSDLKTYTVRGKTYPHRTALKLWGGVWDRSQGAWVGVEVTDKCPLLGNPELLWVCTSKEEESVRKIIRVPQGVWANAKVLWARTCHKVRLRWYATEIKAEEELVNLEEKRKEEIRLRDYDRVKGELNWVYHIREEYDREIRVAVGVLVDILARREEQGSLAKHNAALRGAYPDCPKYNKLFVDYDTKVNKTEVDEFKNMWVGHTLASLPKRGKRYSKIASYVYGK